MKQKQKKKTKLSYVFRMRIISRADGLHVGFLKARFRFLLVGRRTRSRLMASLVCPIQGIGQLLLTVHRLQKSVLLFIPVRTNSKTKGLERGGKQRARLGRDAKTKGWFLFSRLTRPLVRVRLLGHAKPIFF